ncbi:MAG: NADP-dependent oxidoreductase [Myxococcota bacterium]
MAQVNRQYRLVARPTGMVTPDLFEAHDVPLTDLSDNEVRVRQVYLSLDPASRAWMTEQPSYMPPVGLGEVMRGMGIGVVEESRHPDFAPNQLVAGLLGWQTYAVGNPKTWGIQPVPGDLPIPTSTYVSVLGVSGGVTSYFGMLDIGQPKEGETVIVSGAAGSVGSIAGQIARIKGCRVVGFAGSDAKCSYVTEELGFDACINYKTENLDEALARTCPNGVDINFENVGGAILDAVLGHINVGARVVLCGLISQYNATQPTPGPYRFGMLLVRRARLEGFIVTDYAQRFPEAFAQLAQWIQQGKLKHKETIVEGLDQAPVAINKLFTGEKLGKLLIQVSEDPRS